MFSARHKFQLKILDNKMRKQYSLANICLKFEEEKYIPGVSIDTAVQTEIIKHHKN
jgi:hypothetical protein